MTATVPTATTATLGEYRVPAENMGLLETRIAKLNKKCAKLHLLPISVRETSREQKRYKTLDPDTGREVERVREWVNIVLHGQQPKLAGWEFVATLAPTDEGTIISGVPGKTVPAKYRDTDLRCDHCKTVRRRSQVYVVVHDDGRDAQVGSNCLCDFLGHADPHQIAEYAEMLGVLGADIGSWGSGGGGPHEDHGYALDGFLAETAYVVRVAGWRSATKARAEGGAATVHNVLSLFYSGSALTFRKFREQWERKYGAVAITDADKELADKATEWAAAVTPKDDSDYLHNIRIVARTGVVSRRTFGLGASIIGSYKRSVSTENEKKEFRKSEYFGTVGQREVFTLTVYGMVDVNSQFGPCTLHKMRDAQGNIAMWFGRGCGLQIGQTYKLKATVKEHREYQGMKQTMLSRVTLAK